MKLLQLNLLLLPFLVVTASSVANLNCKNVLKTAGLSENFPANVGHSIHGLTLHDLKKLDPSVTEDNVVPTIGEGADGEITILNHVPDTKKSPDSDKFLTESMRIVDEIYSHIDDRKYLGKYISVVEAVAHRAHMEEQWAHTLLEFNKVKSNAPDDNTCACALDVNRNGIMRVLFNTIMIDRDPKLIFPINDNFKNFTDGDLRFVSSGHTLGSAYMVDINDSTKLNFNPADFDLTGSKAWALYKEKLEKTNTKQLYFDGATFLYCALYRKQLIR